MEIRLKKQSFFNLEFVPAAKTTKDLRFLLSRICRLRKGMVIKMKSENCGNEAWHDSSVEKIIIEYNDITAIIETNSEEKRIVFKNYIALEYIGQWDENIVASIYEDSDNDFVEDALKKVNRWNNTKNRGGGTRDINAKWKCYVIKLIDNVCIKIICDNVVFE